MNDEEVLKVIKIVENLNNIFQEAVFEESGKDDLYFIPFAVTVGSGNLYYPVVTFMEQHIWGGDDDQRSHKRVNEEDTDEKEDLNDYLITQAAKILKQINIGFGPVSVYTNDEAPSNS